MFTPAAYSKLLNHSERDPSSIYSIDTVTSNEHFHTEIDCLVAHPNLWTDFYAPSRPRETADAQGGRIAPILLLHPPSSIPHSPFTIPPPASKQTPLTREGPLVDTSSLAPSLSPSLSFSRLGRLNEAKYFPPFPYTQLRRAKVSII